MGWVKWRIIGKNRIKLGQVEKVKILSDLKKKIKKKRKIFNKKEPEVKRTTRKKWIIRKNNLVSENLQQN